MILLLATGAAGSGAVHASSPARALAAGTQATAGAAAPAQNIVEDPGAGYRYVVPDGWASERGDGYALVVSPDRSVRIAILAAESGMDKNLAKAIELEAGRVIKDLRRDGALENRKVNGIKTATAKGTGAVEGLPVTWRASRLELAKPVFVVGFAETASFESHRPAIDKFVASFRKL